MSEFNFKVGDKIVRLHRQDPVIITAIGKDAFLALNRNNAEHFQVKMATDGGPWVKYVEPSPFVVGAWVQHAMWDQPRKISEVNGPWFRVADHTGAHTIGFSGYTIVPEPPFLVGDYVACSTQVPRKVIKVWYDGYWKFRYEGHDYRLSMYPNNSHGARWYTKVDPPKQTVKYMVEVEADHIELAGLSGVVSVRKVGS